MNKIGNDEIVIDIRELLHVFKKNMWIIFLCSVLFATIIGLYSKYIATPRYSSTTKLYILTKSASLSSLSLSDLQIGTQLTKDYMVLVKSRPVTSKVVKNLGLDMTHEQLIRIMTITNPTDTRILEITVNYPDAYLAKTIVDEIAKVSSEQIAQIMDIEEPNIVEEGYLPTTWTTPNVKKNTLIGAVIGFTLSTAVFLLLSMMDDTIKNSEDIERYLGLNTLGYIPMVNDSGNRKGKLLKRKTSKGDRGRRQHGKSKI